MYVPVVSPQARNTPDKPRRVVCGDVKGVSCSVTGHSDDEKSMGWTTKLIALLLACQRGIKMLVDFRYTPVTMSIPHPSPLLNHENTSAMIQRRPGGDLERVPVLEDSGDICVALCLDVKAKCHTVARN